MLRPLATGLLAVSLLFSASGCTTLADVRAAQGSGEVRVYDATYDRVWNIIPDVLKDLGLKEEGHNKASGYVVAQGKRPLLNVASDIGLGENLAIFIDKAEGPNRTKVEVIARNKLSIGALTDKLETRVHEQLASRLGRSTR